ncbi:MAG: hypothetical protein ACPIOQ_72370, partial [Promethearchaeia archaeon]
AFECLLTLCRPDFGSVIWVPCARARACACLVFSFQSVQLHRTGLIHRDIKPENLLVVPGLHTETANHIGAQWVMDFCFCTNACMNRCMAARLHALAMKKVLRVNLVCVQG